MRSKHIILQQVGFEVRPSIMSTLPYAKQYQTALLCRSSTIRMLATRLPLTRCSVLNYGSVDRTHPEFSRTSIPMLVWMYSDHNNENRVRRPPQNRTPHGIHRCRASDARRPVSKASTEQYRRKMPALRRGRSKPPEVLSSPCQPHGRCSLTVIDAELALQILH
jgi:hypothetical protein